jgi:hypothetical protein
MEMAKYIYSILRSQLNIMWSWGFNSPIALENGLKFKVQGFIHRGWVVVKYNEGKDLFEVILLDKKGNSIKEVEDVFFDMLVDVIDGLVEKTNDYKKRIEQEYSLQ